MAAASAYRAEQIGSLLRPARIKEARAAYRRGEIGRARLEQVEDEEILVALRRQRDIGIDLVTDGEFRRTGFQNDMIEAVEGFVDTGQPAVVRIWQGPGGEPQEQGTRQVVGATLKPRGRLTGTQTAFLARHAAASFKMTVPSPTQFPAISFQPGVTDRHYPTRSHLLADLTSIVRAEIQALVADGVPYIQMDCPRYSYYVDPTWRQHLQDLGEDPERAFDEAIAADGTCLEGVKRQGLTLGFHICRGNNQSKWYAQGGYDPIAEKLFGTLPVDRWLLEYDTERAGTFEPLRFMPRDRTVVLGLISSKDPRRESLDELRRRLDEAARYVPMEHLAISPQCGFASTAAGNLMTEDEQWRKLQLVVETARKVWG